MMIHFQDRRGSLAPLQKPRRNHRPLLWIEALSDTVFVPAKELCGIVKTYVAYVAWIYIFATQFPFEEINLMNPCGDLWKMIFFTNLKTKIEIMSWHPYIFVSSSSRLSWGTVKRATCFATVTFLHSIPMYACFTTHESNLSFNKSDCCRLQIAVSESRKYSYTFCYKICVLCVLPAQSKLDVIPVYSMARLPPNFIQSGPSCSKVG